MKRSKQVSVAKVAIMHDGTKLYHSFTIEDWEAPIHTGYIMDSGHTLCRKCCSVAVAKVGLSIVGLSSSNDLVVCENQKCKGGK